MHYEDDNIVEVPDTQCPLSQDNLFVLQQLVDPLGDDGNYGISFYNRTVAEETRMHCNQFP